MDQYNITLKINDKVYKIEMPNEPIKHISINFDLNEKTEEKEKLANIDKVCDSYFAYNKDVSNHISLQYRKLNCKSLNTVIQHLPNYNILKKTNPQLLDMFIETCDILKECFDKAYKIKYTEISQYMVFFQEYLLKFITIISEEEYNDFMIALAKIGIDDKIIIILKDIRSGLNTDLKNIINYDNCSCYICSI